MIESLSTGPLKIGLVLLNKTIAQRGGYLLSGHDFAKVYQEGFPSGAITRRVLGLSVCMNSIASLLAAGSWPFKAD